MQRVRSGELMKRPGVSETLDWARALLLLGAGGLDAETVEATLGCIFKYQEDLRQFRRQVWDSPEARQALLSACGADGGS